MLKKYVIEIFEGRPIGISYNDITEVCIIGGKYRVKELIDHILEDYFPSIEEVNITEKQIQKNKFRYYFTISKKDFFSSIKELEKADFPVTEVYNLQEIMR